MTDDVSAKAADPPLAAKACSLTPLQREPMMRSSDAPTETPTDSDGDGLSNRDEEHMCTVPSNKDTDGDGLLDGWEVRGVNGIALYAKKALPRRKDVFVWMAYMQGERPSANVLKRIEAAYAAAPVPNEDGSTGISIHLELEEPAVEVDTFVDRLVPKFFAIKHRALGTFQADYIPVFHYMIWAYQLTELRDTGWAIEGIGGPDFVVTLQGSGSEDEKVGTFVHELGHTLGLYHGGVGPDGVGSDSNLGPNHLSVMNHLFQTRGVPYRNGRLFTYQSVNTAALREDQLDETAGIGLAPAIGDYVTFWHPARLAKAGGPIDWNGRDGFQRRIPPLDLDGLPGVTHWPAITNEWRRLDYSSRGTIGSHDKPAQLVRDLRKAAERAERELGERGEVTLEKARLAAAVQVLAEQAEMWRHETAKLKVVPAVP